jgi:Mn-dependent DtxR family transcriptional regulator
MKQQLTDSAQAVLDLVIDNPTKCTGEIALYLGRSIDSTKRILNELRAKGLVDCLYGEKALQCWYPVVRLDR